MDERWGVGDQAKALAFDTAMVGDEVGDLIFGQYPHSRSDDRVYWRSKDGSVIEGFRGHRVCVRTEVAERNYMKRSGLSGNEVRSSCIGRVYFDGFLVFERSLSRDHATTMRKLANEVIPTLHEVPGIHSEAGRAALEGRPVWFKETAARVRRVLWKQGTVIVEAEEGCKFPIPYYTKGPDPMFPLEDDERTISECCVLDPSLRWYREEGIV